MANQCNEFIKNVITGSQDIEHDIGQEKAKTADKFEENSVGEISIIVNEIL